MSIFDNIIDARNRLLLSTKLVYAVSEELTPGNVLVMDETDFGFGFAIFHSEEEAQAVAATAGVPLLHVRDAPRKRFRGLALPTPRDY
jgi:hypothetical protein